MYYCPSDVSPLSNNNIFVKRILSIQMWSAQWQGFELDAMPGPSIGVATKLLLTNCYLKSKDLMRLKS